MGGKQGGQKGTQKQDMHLHLTLQQAEILVNPRVAILKSFLNNFDTILHSYGTKYTSSHHTSSMMKRQVEIINCTYDTFAFNCPVNGKPSGQIQKGLSPIRRGYLPLYCIQDTN